MKKSLIALTTMLSFSAAFVSCSKTDLYDEAAIEKAKQLEVEAQYKEGFVKHFGEVDPNQSWDFTQPTAQSARTRFSLINAVIPIWREVVKYDDNLYSHAATDFEQVKACAEGNDVPVVAWPYDYAEIKLHPFYSKGCGLLNHYYLGIVYKGLGLLTNFNKMKVSAAGNEWSSLITDIAVIQRRNIDYYYQANTNWLLDNPKFKWVVACGEYDRSGINVDQHALTKCKLFTVNGHTYVALDCNGDNVYTDLICWVEDLAPAKRYFVEDLGANDDFDFNDIVFDVVRKAGTGEGTGKPAAYECIIRAMGGTIDFSLQLAKGTPWVKSEHVVDITKMENTEGTINPNAVLAKFDVPNWIPEDNDVVVTVKTNKGVFGLPFPKKGEIPFMIATYVEKDWSKERVNVNDINWFGAIENDGTVELKD